MEEESTVFSDVHVEDERHTCDSCDIIFKSIPELHSHIKDVHKGSKNYLCDMCEDGFWQMSSLESHISSIHLKSEEIVHSNEEETNESFEDSKDDGLHEHEKNKTESNPKDDLKNTIDGRLNCNFCSQSYENKEALDLHFKSVHIEGKILKHEHNPNNGDDEDDQNNTDDDIGKTDDLEQDNLESEESNSEDTFEDDEESIRQ